ncbi:YdcF family protein [Piscinibacter sp. XHJ-5]|uniref:YdcF family protein n=1 Tax=Piscinibacter sp. XHJ-5 TaxID=3037797 RepID=UPI0024528FF6|nr:YdcF family protein [Piscinibacter sp. XHJ-5]
MNSVFASVGIEAWKPILTALVLPPVPLLLLVVVGAWLLPLRRILGWTLVVLGVAGVWLSSTMAAGRWLEGVLLRVPPALSAERIQAIKAEAVAHQAAIVVLGGGVEPFAPEYGSGSLAAASLERLRYGVWLSRETGVPVAFSGGLGWAQSRQRIGEAEVAAHIASREFGLPLRWVETRSRDTRENAAFAVPLLQKSGVRHILLVTHGWHMPRAQRQFEAAALAAAIRVEAAPMGLGDGASLLALDWLPSADGHQRVRQVLREAVGRLALA